MHREFTPRCWSRRSTLFRGSLAFGSQGASAQGPDKNPLCALPAHKIHDVGSANQAQGVQSVQETAGAAEGGVAPNVPIQPVAQFRPGTLVWRRHAECNSTE